MWSLGAVLFHVLCGHPPYTGRGDDKGFHMLRTIMTTEPEYNLLRKVGVSEEGIDFVGRLLHRDPFCRPNERECFKHAWIADVEDIDEYESDDSLFPGDEAPLSDIGEDVEGELDASQLSLYDKQDASPEPEDYEPEHDAQVKRRRFDYPSLISYPSLPEISAFDLTSSVPNPGGKRLFGEITRSGRPSSTGFHASLDVFEGDDFSVHDFVSSTGESISESNSLYSIVSLPDYRFCGSAPSLMGAENLVGQLNMNSSPNVDGRALEAPIKLRSPRQAQAVMANDGSNDERRKTSASDGTPKAPKFSRRIELPLPETSSERSSIASTRRGDTKQDVGEPGTKTGEDPEDPELAVTVDEQTGREVAESPKTTGDEGPRASPSHALQIPPTPESDTTARHNSSSTPRTPLLGKLTTVPGSIFDLTIQLKDRMTSWGRGPHASICYPKPLDTRIPAYALEVTFWAPAIESRIAAGEDWTKVPGVMTILSTKASRCIWVNGSELRRGPRGEHGQQGFHYGKLYTNDIITVFKHKEQYLKFRCEFYHGDSARERPEEEKGFIVHKVQMSKEDVNAQRLPVQRDGH